MDNKDYAYPLSMGNGFIQKGITKRDYFAAIAMQGLLAAGKDGFVVNGSKMNLDTSSYFIADAMIKEGEK